MTNKELLEKVKKLQILFQEGKIPTLAQHELHPELDTSSKENYLYFTLAPALNFQRSSPALWIAALKTYEDPQTRYLFTPGEVGKRSREEIQKDLLKHKLSLQPNKHTDIWITLSRTFSNLYGGDPRTMLHEHDWDVLRIHTLMQQERKKDFPYLSGVKMANYWLYILSHYTDATFKNMHEISIIPDTHVMQSSVQLGLTPTLGNPQEVARLWKELLLDSDITPVQMHPVLWNWSRNNFLPEV